MTGKNSLYVGRRKGIPTLLLRAKTCWKHTIQQTATEETSPLGRKEESWCSQSRCSPRRGMYRSRNAKETRAPLTARRRRRRLEPWEEAIRQSSKTLEWTRNCLLQNDHSRHGENLLSKMIAVQAAVPPAPPNPCCQNSWDDRSVRERREGRTTTESKFDRLRKRQKVGTVLQYGKIERFFMCSDLWQSPNPGLSSLTITLQSGLNLLLQFA